MSTVDELPLQRGFNSELLQYVSSHPLFKAMKPEIDKGTILPALRRQEVHFYEAGARLLRFTTRRVFTHCRYIDGCGNKERALKQDEWDLATLKKIRHTIDGYRTRNQANNELSAVHQLFPKFAITRSRQSAGELALVDVEARFAGEGDLRTGMIDLVFLLPEPDCRLLFVEAKCVGNTAIAGGTGARIVSQLENYQLHIARATAAVLKAMNRSLSLQSELVKPGLGQAKGIVPTVPVLILNPDKRELAAGDVWLKKALEAKPERPLVTNKVAVINGMESAVKAITEFACMLSEPRRA
jgi:hypothetical protein